MALPRRLPSLERYAAARRLMARVPGTDPEAVDTCLWLWRFSEVMSASFEAFYAAHGLSSARGHVLLQLYEAERGLTPAQLADRAGMTPPSMTGLLRLLQRQGLIRRQRMSGDRRSHCILLTAAGRRRVESLLPTLASRLSQLAGALGPAEREAMVAGSRRLCDQARALREAAPQVGPDGVRAVSAGARSSRR